MELGILQHDQRKLSKEAERFLHMLKTHIQEYGFEVQNLDFLVHKEVETIRKIRDNKKNVKYYYSVEGDECK